MHFQKRVKTILKVSFPKHVFVYLLKKKERKKKESTLKINTLLPTGAFLGEAYNIKCLLPLKLT